MAAEPNGGEWLEGSRSGWCMLEDREHRMVSRIKMVYSRDRQRE
jgi:hypothetical protein